MEVQTREQNKIKYKLNGHSGCKLELINDDGHIFVSKTSGSLEYNLRLRKQFKKQNSYSPPPSHTLFLSNKHTQNTGYNVLTPKIIKNGYDNGLFYFNMEFIQGKTLAEYTNDISIGEIADLICCLFKSLYWENSKRDVKSAKIFNKKIAGLKEKLNNENQLSEAFNILESFDWTNVYKSACHGDLTLENILITKDKKLYLIDFLDSFYNSWQIDIAKLLQDLELKWAFRDKDILPVRAMRLEVARDALIEEVLKIKDGKEKLKTIYHLLLLNVIRIYPYTKDKSTLLYLNKAVEILTKKLKRKDGWL